MYYYYLAKKGSRAEGSICSNYLYGCDPYPKIEKIIDKPEKGKEFCYKLVPVSKMTTRPASWDISATVTEEKLFGPATLKSGVIVYPCNKWGCWVFCSCQICRQKYVPGEPAGKNNLMKEHRFYHRAWHLDCKYCKEVYEMFSMYRSLIWDAKKEIFFDLGVFKHCFHYEQKSEEEKLKCNLCDLVFATVAIQVRHYKSVHTKEIYHCIQCEAVFNRKDKLKEHVDDTHESIIKCEDCSKVFTSLKNLQRHMDTRLVNKKPKYVCSDCSRIFCTMNLLKNHERKHDYTCDRCNTIFSSKFNLEIHKSKTSVKCDECNREFCTNKRMIFHKNNTHGHVFECEQCGKTFVSKFNKKRHINQKHQS